MDTIELARYLIGKTLVHDLPVGRLSGRIVETEGYPPGDAAGRAFRGKIQGNQSLFLGRGYCHVYFTYGSSFMVNVTAEKPGIGAGVLLRALEPLEGIDTMKRFRKTTCDRDIARGPGRLAEALHIDMRYDGVDLCAAGSLWLGTAVKPIAAVPRIRKDLILQNSFDVINPTLFQARAHSKHAGPLHEALGSRCNLARRRHRRSHDWQASAEHRAGDGPLSPDWI